MKIAIIIIALITILTASLQADKSKMRGYHKMNPELKSEIIDYKNQNMIPKFKEWKNRIDNSISSSELTILNSLRAEAKALKAETKVKFKELKAQRDQGKEVNKEEMKAQFEQTKESYRILAEKLKPIAENNKELMVEIGSELKEYSKIWEKEMNGLTDKYNDSDRRRKKHRKSRKEGKKAMVRLLLWDGESTFEEDQSQMLQELNSNAYPNPFESSSNINFETHKTEYTTIKIYDENGNLVETLFEGELDAGNHNFNFAPNNSNKAGVYFYQIESKSIKENGKLYLNK